MSNSSNNRKGYWFRPEDGEKDIPIRQYLRLDYLIELLETQMYYAKRRKYFQDANESDYDIRLVFRFKPIGENVNPQPELEPRKMSFREIIECPTSCWTKRIEESYLMWKSYATEIGACIISSTHRIINSINIDFTQDRPNRLIFGSMNYVKICRSVEEEQQLFNKSLIYSDEKEFRFYFDFKTGIIAEKYYALIPVNTTTLIQEIQLSPFISKIAADEIKKIIEECYGIKVSQSKIQLRS